MMGTGLKMYFMGSLRALKRRSSGQCDTPGECNTIQASRLVSTADYFGAGISC